VNTPNKLTIIRLFLTFIFMFFLFSKGIFMKFAALITFLAASITDYYDGKIARATNQVTDFGKFMDPIADKVLIIASFLAFVEMGLVPAWMVVLIISRELLITGLRLFAAAKGKILQAGRAGKHKTVSQIVAVFTILVFILFRELGWGIFQQWIIDIVMITTVILTLTSGISYIWRNKTLFLT